MKDFVRGNSIRDLSTPEFVMPEENSTLQEAIGDLVEQFERKEMGIRPSSVNVMVRGDVVIVHLKEVLPPPEKHLALTERARIWWRGLRRCFSGEWRNRRWNSL